MAFLLLSAIGNNGIFAQSQKQTGDVKNADTTAAKSQAPVVEKKDTSRFKKEKVDIDQVVNFSAKDSIVMLGKDVAKMYSGSKIVYGDIDVSAYHLNMDMTKSEVLAFGDSIKEDKSKTQGQDQIRQQIRNAELSSNSSSNSKSQKEDEEVQGKPVFKDNSGSYESDTLRYNFKSGKGLIKNIVTEQGDGFLTGGITKKDSTDDYYIKDGKYTTCDNHEHPHFYFSLTKAKVRPKKDVVMGPAYMVLEDLPLPLAVPFGFFPFTDKFHSGVLMPTFGEDYNRGFFLRNGGYYLALSDYADLALTGEIYTRGSWGITAQSHYTKRYKFSGNFSISFLTTVEGEKGDDDYSKSKNFSVVWSHSQDSKANPNMTFSASVNFQTTGYSRNNLDSYYNSAFTENTKSSTVNLTYKRPGSKWSFSTTANVSQRTADSTLTVSFPNLTVTMQQLAPFKRKHAVGDERWYEKIKISYSGRFQNSLTASQNEFFKKSLVKDWKNGMYHSIPVQATFNLFKYFNITPSISMNDRMYTNKIRQSWDPNSSAVVRDTSYNFYNVFDFSASISLSTKIYGFFKPAKFLGDKIGMIRHVITPTISFSASPDFSDKFWGYYGTYEKPNSSGGVDIVKYNYFSHGLYGSASSGKSGTFSFSIANNVEAKVKSDEDSTGYKKVSIIENLTLSQSCNLAADSMKWSNLNTSLLLRITKGFNLNLSATWDVYKYAVNSEGTPVRINKLRLFNGGGWGRLSSTGTSFSYTLNNDTFKNLFGKKDKKDKDKDKEKNNRDNRQQNRNGEQNDQNEQQNSDIKLNKDGYMAWEFPWSLTFNYSLNYGYGDFDYKKLEYKGKWTQNLSLNGNIRPTKNWNFTWSASYNFDTHKIAYMNCSISREMHCFTMSASFVPVGPYKSYSFHIAVKSSILSDVKYDKHSSYSNGVTWY